MEEGSIFTMKEATISNKLNKIIRSLYSTLHNLTLKSVLNTKPQNIAASLLKESGLIRNLMSNNSVITLLDCLNITLETSSMHKLSIFYFWQSKFFLKAERKK